MMNIGDKFLLIISIGPITSACLQSNKNPTLRLCSGGGEEHAIKEKGRKRR